MTPDDIKDKALTVTKRRFRLTLDVEVSVKDVPQAILESGAVLPSYGRTPKAEFVEFVQFQRRLLQTVLQKDELFSQYIQEHACSIAANFLHEEFMTPESEILSSEDVVDAVFDQLPASDQESVREMIEHGSVSDNVEIGLFDPLGGKVISFAVEELGA